MAAWGLLGFAHTAIAMIRHHGWLPDASPDASWTVGLPDNERAPDVKAVRQLIAAAQPIDRVLVVVPAHADTAAAGTYLRFQLAVLEYPTRIHFEAARSAGTRPAGAAASPDAPAILAPRVPAPAERGAPRARVAGYRLYR